MILDILEANLYHFKMKATAKALVATVIIATVVGWVMLHYGGGGKSDRPPTLKPKDSPDLVMTGGVSFIEVEKGEVVWRASADSATYDMVTEVLKLEKPTAVQMKAATPEYRISGNIGTYDTKNRMLSMKGNVKGASRSGYTLDTESILYDMRKRIATTSDPVSIKGDGLDIKGTGMILNIMEERIQILNDVKLYAVPQVIDEKGDPK